MRVAVSVLALCVAAGALAGCSSYSRYEHEEQLRHESRQRWSDDDRAYSRERPRREARAPAKRPPRKVTISRPAEKSVIPHRSRAVETARQEPATEAPSAKTAAPAPATPAPVAAPAKPAPVAPVAAAPASAGVAAAAAATSNKSAPAVAAPPSTETSAARKEIADGYRLLRAGFVKKARERFDAAMGAAAGDATLGHGRSLDPTYLKSVAFPDAEPDAEEARKLYRRAILLGSNEAKTDLERLESATATAQPSSSPEAPAKPGG